jgi:diguanylate cyclase (GGDEF)-like protein
MLANAISFMQDIQFVCFAAVFFGMALQNKENLSLRWLAYCYVAGVVGGVVDLAGAHLPAWLASGVDLETVPVCFACAQAGIVQFLRSGWRMRWISLGFLLATLPFYLLWCHPGQEVQRIALLNFTVAIQTGLTGWLLLRSSDAETRWPRTVMGGFAAFFCIIESSKLLVLILTGQFAATVSPLLENVSGAVYVVTGSMLPLGYIWMVNARLHSELKRQNITDPLTQVLNRRGLQAAGERELARCRRYGQDLAVVIADIDHFKVLNDTYGHAGGDFVLSSAALLLRERLRQSDIIGRFGGEEFVLLLPATSSSGALEMSERLRLALEDHTFQLLDREVSVTASFGVAVLAGRFGLTWEMILNEADMALYAAKRDGRNCCRIYDRDSTAMAARSGQ